MCNAFSGVIDRAKKVYWKAGIDSHSDIIEHFNLDDTRNDDSLCPFEIVPKNDDYLNPDEWQFNFDMGTPDWWKRGHETACWHAFKEWEKEVYGKINLVEARNPINPLKIEAPKKITKKHIKLLFSWASVWDSVRASVRASVGASVMAYIGSLFSLKRKEWKYTENIKTKRYPFQSLVDLWQLGLVPSFDGKIWRLHAGLKAEIVFEITKEELLKCV